MANQQQPSQQQQKVQIRAKDEDLKGAYSNMAQIMHSQEEFIIDFFNIVGQQGVLASRVVLSPGHLKRLVGALQKNVELYEKNFGNISPAEEPKREVGF